MKKILISFFVCLSLTFWWSVGFAAPVIMNGTYIQTQVGDDGTLGNGYSSPGLKYGGGEFLMPGDPWEIFSIKSNETGLLTNKNSGTDKITGGTLTDLSGTTYDHFARWEGSYESYFDITIDTFFNDDDQFIKFYTTITAKDDLNDVKFLRAIDPDQDRQDPTGTFETNNYRGFGSFSESDWVYAVGPNSDLTIGLYSDSSIAHNTGVVDWSYDPEDYWGTNVGNGDYTIGIAFDLGDLTAGSSVSFSYAYVLGESPSDAASHIPVSGPTSVPEPMTLLLLGTGLISMSILSKKTIKK